AEQVGNFRTMSAARHSENTYFSVLALRRLGAAHRAEELQTDLAEFTADLASTEPHIPYFATSLPQLLLFPADLREGRDVQVAFFRAQLHALAGDLAAARDQLTEVLAAAPEHAEAHDLLTELADRTDQESAR